MTQPAAPDDGIIVQVTTALADTTMGQRVAVIITALLPKDQAEITGKAITDLAAGLSGAGLVAAAGNGTAPEGGP